jgi:hypothetical protein
LSSDIGTDFTDSDQVATKGRWGVRTTQLFSWDVECRRLGGVTNNPALAAAHVFFALRDAPAGAVGTVRRVVLSMSGHVEYEDLGEVARVRRAADGELLWWAER